MKTKLRAAAGLTLLIVSVLMLTACPRPEPDQIPRRVASAPASSADIYLSFDKLQADLKKRAREKIGDAPDYSIVVSDVSYPIGTLLRMNQFIPKSSCNIAAGKTPVAADAPSMFPGYRLSKSVALSLGLDSAVLSKVAELGAALKDDDVLSYQVNNTKVSVIFDDGLKELLATPECLQAIGDQKLRMVRGHITGKRDFTLSSALAANFKAGVTQVGKVEISGSNGTGITMKDTEPTAFLLVMTDVEPSAQSPGVIKTSATKIWLPTSSVDSLPGPPVWSQAKPMPQVTSPPIRKPGDTEAVDTEAVQKAIGAAKGAVVLSKVFVHADALLIYVQQDKADKTNTQALLKELRKTFKVAGSVEKLDSAKMPSRAQVRYFSEKDRAKAEEVVEQLKAQGYASAAPVYIGIASPPGQLEVWLPKK
jgi:hypothetical protein